MSVSVLPTPDLRLYVGAHEQLEAGYCAMELVSFVAGEKWTDHPKCTSPVIGAVMRGLNDRLSNTDRQRLLPYLVECDSDGVPVIENGMLKPGKVVGTATTQADEEIRGWMCFDWMIHEWAPARFRLVGATAAAEAFEALAQVVDRDTYLAARTVVHEVRDAMWAKRRELIDRAVAVAVADAVAVAVAGAVADAVAVAVAGADADAVAGAVADAVAVAGADADAVADAGADADADADADAVEYRALLVEAAKAALAAGANYWDRRDAAYEVLRPFWDRKFADVTEGQLTSVLLLVDRLCAVGRPA